MKYTITFEGDYYEDWDEFKDITALKDSRTMLHDVREILRRELKHGEHDEKTEAVLERIQSMLYVNE